MEDQLILECPYCGGRTRPYGHTKTGRPYRWCDKCKRKYMASPKRCVICGGIIPRKRIHGNTCCDACYDKKIKTAQLNYYYKKTAEDPEFNKKRNERNKERPEYIEARKAYYKIKWSRIKENREKFEAAKEKQRRFYAEHAEEIQAARKERLNTLSPEELADWVERVRESSRLCSAKYRSEREKSPEAQAVYREKMREYHRKRKLAKLMETMYKLEEKL